VSNAGYLLSALGYKVSDPGHVVSAFYDEVPAGKYSMSDREHVLSAFFD
jgi:hypothetical protein